MSADPWEGNGGICVDDNKKWNFLDFLFCFAGGEGEREWGGGCEKQHDGLVRGTISSDTSPNK